MKELESRLDPTHFARVHRSAIVCLDRIRNIQPGPHGDFEINLDTGDVVPMSRTYRDAVLDRE
jgi:two-component system LytT family response regulator